jgi:hypothetical protein
MSTDATWTDLETAASHQQSIEMDIQRCYERERRARSRMKDGSCSIRDTSAKGKTATSSHFNSKDVGFH